MPPSDDMDADDQWGGGDELKKGAWTPEVSVNR